MKNRGVSVILAVLACATASTAAGASGRALRFASIEHHAQPWTPTNVLPKVGRSAVSIIDTASGSPDPKLSRVEWNRNFGIGVAFAGRTSGYSITIERILLQNITRRRRQFCVTAKIMPPKQGTAVYQQPTLVEHVVRLSRRPFRTSSPYQWTIPKAAVLRDARGKILATGVLNTGGPNSDVYPPRPRLCR